MLLNNILVCSRQMALMNLGSVHSVPISFETEQRSEMRNHNVGDQD